MPDIIEIASSDGRLRLDLCPQIGGSVTAFRIMGENGPIDIFRPWDRAVELAYPPLMTSSFPMTPYTNRIADCRLQFNGQTYHVGPASDPEPHALHGDGWKNPWQVKERGPDFVELALTIQASKDSPYSYDAIQVYRLSDDALHIDLSVTNKGAEALPFGIGHHPFLPRDAETIVRSNLKKAWMGKDIIPDHIEPMPERWNFSEGLVVSNENLGPAQNGFDHTFLMDHCFPDWDGKTEIIWPRRGLKLEITADDIFKHFVICVPQPEQPVICAEAVTNIIDAFNKYEQGVADTGTQILQPGETLAGRTNFRPELL